MNTIYDNTFVLGQTSATNFIAGPGIVIDSPSAGTMRIGTDETVLYDSSALINTDKALGTTFQISEPVSNFERFRIYYIRFPLHGQSPCQQIQEFDSTVPVNNIVLHTTFATSTATNTTWYDCAGIITDISGTTWKLNSCMQKQLPNGNLDQSWFYLKPYKIVGINRKEV